MKIVTWSAAIPGSQKRRRRPGAIVDKLRRTIEKQGPKAVVGNRGYARFLKVAKGSATIDEDAVQRDARLDGQVRLLRTNTNLSAVEVAQTYKSLWRMERTFREQKSTLEVRPIYHHGDDTSIGHIVASFLALRLEVDLQQRLDERQVEVSWPDLMRDLGQVQSVLLDLDENRYQLRKIWWARRITPSLPLAFAHLPRLPSWDLCHDGLNTSTCKPCSAKHFFVLLKLLLSHYYFYLTVEFKSECAIFNIIFTT